MWLDLWPAGICRPKACGAAFPRRLPWTMLGFGVGSLRSQKGAIGGRHEALTSLSPETPFLRPLQPRSVTLKHGSEAWASWAFGLIFEEYKD